MGAPKYLYKYRKFDASSLRVLTDHELYFADPRLFNDPLDCNLSINPDISMQEMSTLLRAVLGADRKKPLRAVVQSAVHDASELGNYKVQGDARNFLKLALADLLKEEVRRELEQHGVLSFSATWQSVLMWSHYADEHRGLCFEFDTTELEHRNLAPVAYTGERSVRASDIRAWRMDGDKVAEKSVLDKHFYSKAPEWSYEQEWRDIREAPGQCGSYRVSGVYFGIRCDHSIKVAVVKMLRDNSNVKLYDVEMRSDTFDLRKVEVDCGEIDALGMREPQEIYQASIMEKFDDLE